MTPRVEEIKLCIKQIDTNLSARLYSDRQNFARTSVTLQAATLFLPRSDVICALSEYKHTAKCNLFVNKKTAPSLYLRMMFSDIGKQLMDKTSDKLARSVDPSNQLRNNLQPRVDLNGLDAVNKSFIHVRPMPVVKP